MYAKMYIHSSRVNLGKVECPQFTLYSVLVLRTNFETPLFKEQSVMAQVAQPLVKERSKSIIPFLADHVCFSRGSVTDGTSPVASA